MSEALGAALDDGTSPPPSFRRRVVIGAAVMFTAWIPLSLVAGAVARAAPVRVAWLTLAPPIGCLAVACLLGGFVAGRLERRMPEHEISPMPPSSGLRRSREPGNARVGVFAGLSFGAGTWLLALVVSARAVHSTGWVIWLASLAALLLVGGACGWLGAALGGRRGARRSREE